VLEGAPGLVITATCARLRPFRFRASASKRTGIADGWRVTHVASGTSLPAWFTQAVDAAAFALLLAKGLDWTRKHDEMDLSEARGVFERASRIMAARVPEFFEGHSWGRNPWPGDIHPVRWM